MERQITPPSPHAAVPTSHRCRQAGLKIICTRSPGFWRVFVDGVDTGRTCPVEERIALQPGAHHMTLVAPATGRTIELTHPANVRDRGASTRVVVDR